MPVAAVALGPQVLRVSYLGQCPVFEGRSLLPIVYSHVTVVRTGAEWIATASAPQDGDVELRFHVSGAALVAGSMPVRGTVKGVAIHSPDLAPIPGLPPSSGRASFGTDGRTTLEGFAFGPSALTPSAGTSGLGSGAITISDNDGHSCSAATFLWTLVSGS
jgi:hypothetical protein